MASRRSQLPPQSTSPSTSPRRPIMNLVRTWTGQSGHSSPSTDETRPTLTQTKSTTSVSGENWAGHYNRLTEAQQTALSKFKIILREQKLFTPDPLSHDDPTLMYEGPMIWSYLTDSFSRYLRARKWEIPGALAQFRDTETVRRVNKIDYLYDHIDVTFYERGRTFVSTESACESCANWFSILNGQVIEINKVAQSMSSR